MNLKNIFLFNSLLPFFNVALGAPSPHYFRFNNQSKQTIYVWVTQAVNVSGPNASSPPYLALVIKPLKGNKRLRYEINAWSNKTVLSVAFCKVSVRSCINTNGEYSSITLVPASETQWKLKPATAWSGMMLPLPPVWDNVSHRDGLIWKRNEDFPYEIRFFEGRRPEHH